LITAAVLFGSHVQYNVHRLDLDDALRTLVAPNIEWVTPGGGLKFPQLSSKTKYQKARGGFPPLPDGRLSEDRFCLARQ
jgi:hypothetical protein